MHGEPTAQAALFVSAKTLAEQVIACPSPGLSASAGNDLQAMARIRLIEASARLFARLYTSQPELVRPGTSSPCDPTETLAISMPRHSTSVS